MNYRIETFTYNETIRIPANCNAITFINPSALITFKVNNIPVLPNATLSIEGNENETDITDYQIDFGTATTGTCYVIKKVFA